MNIRIKPCQIDKDQEVLHADRRVLHLNDPSKTRTSEFVFDRIFEGTSSQDSVYDECVGPVVEHVLQGYNACCFAYGQTGSGKTYSMFGQESGSWELRGLVPRAAEAVCRGVADVIKTNPGSRVAVYVSFLEVYLDHVRDLAVSPVVTPSGRISGDVDLGGTARSSAHFRSPRGSGGSIAVSLEEPDYLKPGLEIQEEASGSTIVKDLTYTEVRSYTNQGQSGWQYK